MVCVGCFQTPWWLLALNTSVSVPKYLRKSYSLPSLSGGVVTNVWGLKRIPGTLHRAYWHLSISLREMAYLWVQNNHGLHAKYRILRLVTSFGEGCAGHQEYLVPYKWCVTWVISHRSPANHMNLWLGSFGQRHAVGSPKSILCLGLNKTVIFSPQRNNGSPRTKLWCRNGNRKSYQIYGELCIAFLYPSFFSLILSPIRQGSDFS